MFKNNFGKLLIYASNRTPKRKRLQSVRMATEETAKLLNLDYVYYKRGDGDEPIPLYCDEGKVGNLKEIGVALKNMMFVLSFHPKHTALKQVRSAIMSLS
jgi:hypothetical protein